MAVIDLTSRLQITLVPFRFLLEDIYFPRFALDTYFKVDLHSIRSDHIFDNSLIRMSVHF